MSIEEICKEYKDKFKDAELVSKDNGKNIIRVYVNDNALISDFEVEYLEKINFKENYFELRYY